MVICGWPLSCPTIFSTTWPQMQVSVIPNFYGPFGQNPKKIKTCSKYNAFAKVFITGGGGDFHLDRRYVCNSYIHLYFNTFFDFVWIYCQFSTSLLFIQLLSCFLPRQIMSRYINICLYYFGTVGSRVGDTGRFWRQPDES